MDGTATGTGIGQPVRRREDLRLLTGRGRYSDDVNLPGQAYAVMVRSPHAHAWVRGIDTAKALALAYEALPAVAQALDAIKVGAPRARENFPNIILDGDVGDPAATEAAFARAAHIVRLDTWIPRITGVPMEPRAAVGDYDPESGRYTLYGGAGGAGSPRRDVAAVLGVPPEPARVVMQDVGGNFGTRGSFNAEFALVAWAAKRLGRPVKWTSDRQEYFVADHQARDLAVTAELALDREGRFLAMRGSNLVNQGAYALAFGPLNKG